MSVIAAKPSVQAALTVATPVDSLGNGRPPFLVMGFTGFEAVSRPFQYHLGLVADRRLKFNWADMIGNPKGITLTLSTPTGPGQPARQRFFHGICNRISQGETDTTLTHYRVDLVPRLWLLNKKARCRIFQQKSVLDILKEVLGPAAFILRGAFEPRDYCVQYRETDFHFASRLMEEEGIFYFFKHLNGDHQMVLKNSPLAHEQFDLGDHLLKTPEPGKPPPFDVLHAWEKTQELRAGKVHLRDHCFELQNPLVKTPVAEPPEKVTVGKASHQLKVGVTDQLELYDYPGEFAQRYDGIQPGGGDNTANLSKIEADGIRTSVIRAEQEVTGAVAVQGTGRAGAFAAGHKFTVTTLPEDFRARQNQAEGAYLLTGVTHSARQSGPASSRGGDFHYQNTFTASPIDLPLRPPRLTPKPVIQGAQTALVVGVPGDEITVDRHGRVKVQFFWDREGKNNLDSSCWIRVAQSWAGPQFGGHFWPRVGHEVVVNFLEGDPDRPLIVGSVYNAVNPPPYALPEHKTRSGVKTRSTLKGTKGNANEIRFEDKKGAEELLIHAERNLTVSAEANENRGIGGNRRTTIGGDCHTEVNGKSGCQLIVNNGHYYMHTKGTTWMEAGEDVGVVSVENIRLKATKALKCEAGPVIIDARDGIVLKCGASFIVIDKEGHIHLQGASVNINSPKPWQVGPASPVTFVPPEPPADGPPQHFVPGPFDD